jgi:hypothetical protein
MEKHMKSLPVLLLLCGILAGLASYAQAPPPGANPPAAAGAPGENPAAAAAADALPPITLTPEERNAPFNGSFFLTPAEIAAIKTAMAGSGMMGGDISVAVPVPQHRVISVSGLLYRSPKDWIVWMNGQKVTPEKLLPEIVDIKIDSSSHMRLKWYDIGLDKVIAITLRPHQTYDIVTGVLLPGTE